MKKRLILGEILDKSGNFIKRELKKFKEFDKNYKQ